MSVATAIVTVLTALLFLAAAWVKFSEEEHSTERVTASGSPPPATG